MKNKFTDNLIDFDLVLSERLDKLDVSMTSFHDSTKYFSCNTSIIDSEGRKESCGIQKYYPSDLKEKGVLSFTVLLPKMLIEDNNKYFPNDVLSFDFECVISTAEHFDRRKNFAELENDVVVKEKSQNLTVLVDDFKSLYNNGIFSDTELHTSTKTFPAHKGILSARSPVFMRMFSNDMKENSGHVDITDFDDDTIHRMLRYIYTGTLEDLQFQNASKLYEIADKYQIMSLKSRCSSFLKENLCSTNACDAFVLADLHNDDDLRNPVEDYLMRQSESFFDSQEWKDFMNTHPKVAADLMCKKITKSKIKLLS